MGTPGQKETPCFLLYRLGEKDGFVKRSPLIKFAGAKDGSKMIVLLGPSGWENKKTV